MHFHCTTPHLRPWASRPFGRMRMCRIEAALFFSCLVLEFSRWNNLTKMIVEACGPGNEICWMWLVLIVSVLLIPDTAAAHTTQISRNCGRCIIVVWHWLLGSSCHPMPLSRVTCHVSQCPATMLSCLLSLRYWAAGRVEPGRAMPAPHCTVTTAMPTGPTTHHPPPYTWAQHCPGAGNMGV